MKFHLTCSSNVLEEEDLGIPGEKEGNCELGFYDNVLLYIHEMLLNWKNLKKTQKQINLCLSRQKYQPEIISNIWFIQFHNRIMTIKVLAENSHTLI